jgi:hypothetical protein
MMTPSDPVMWDYSVACGSLRMTKEIMPNDFLLLVQTASGQKSKIHKLKPETQSLG